MKKPGQFIFETQIKWLDETKGLLTSRAVADSIKVATPKVLKSLRTDNWSPEHLLIGAVNTGFMSSFLTYTKQYGLAISNFECEAIGHVELTGNHLNFTMINVYPILEIEKNDWLQKAKEVIELTKQNCLVARALNVPVYYYPSIEISTYPFQFKHHIYTKKRELFL